MHKQVCVQLTSNSKFLSKFSRKPLSGISDQTGPPCKMENFGFEMTKVTPEYPPPPVGSESGRSYVETKSVSPMDTFSLVWWSQPETSANFTRLYDLHIQSFRNKYQIKKIGEVLIFMSANRHSSTRIIHGSDWLQFCRQNFFSKTLNIYESLHFRQFWTLDW